MSELELLEKRAADGSRDYWLQKSTGELVCGAENLFCLDILLTERFERGGAA
jgi:hypothetical protein